MLNRETLPTIGQSHLLQRAHLVDGHAQRMEKILAENSHKEKYWILGKVLCKRKNRKTIIKPFLKAYDSLPELQKEAYLYEVDNKAGTNTLLWVMHPNQRLAMPSINKSISVADKTGE